MSKIAVKIAKKSACNDSIEIVIRDVDLVEGLVKSDIEPGDKPCEMAVKGMLRGRLLQAAHKAIRDALETWFETDVEEYENAMERYFEEKEQCGDAKGKRKFDA